MSDNKLPFLKADSSVEVSIKTMQHTRFSLMLATRLGTFSEDECVKVLEDIRTLNVEQVETKYKDDDLTNFYEIQLLLTFLLDVETKFEDKGLIEYRSPEINP